MTSFLCKVCESLNTRHPVSKRSLWAHAMAQIGPVFSHQSAALVLGEARRVKGIIARHLCTPGFTDLPRVLPFLTVSGSFTSHHSFPRMQFKLSVLFVFLAVSITQASAAPAPSLVKRDQPEGKWIPPYIGQVEKRDAPEEKFIPPYIGQVEKRDAPEEKFIPPYIGQVEKRRKPESKFIPPYIGQVQKRQEEGGEGIPPYIGQVLDEEKRDEQKVNGKWIPAYIGQVL